MDIERARMLNETGHSFIITGQCGTGKTYLLRSLIKMSSACQKLAVTATTGMASTQLGMGATTLHHWCGIMDCRYSEEKLHELMVNDDKFAAARRRIMETDILFIDEIGMLSRKVFEMVESVCRFVRNSDRVFGGMQVIACGDFKQLPPVPNHWYNDDGSYCFTSPYFKMAFPHHINLKKVVRQTEPDLIAAVNELCDGCPSPTTIAFLRSLDRPLPMHMNPTFLFGTRFDVDVINQEMVEEMPGAAISFKSVDEGDKQLLRRCDAPKTLILKEGAPVMLTRNIGNGIFNGTRGIVHKIDEIKDPLININGNIIPVQRFLFDVYHPQQQKTLARRSQYPLQLAFALTVHKAQGQTLECVEVDCFSMFGPGQMGVAVGRSVTKDGLRVVNLNLQAATLKHPDEVYAFYAEDCNEILETLECCKQVCENISPCSTEVTPTTDITEEAHSDGAEEEETVLDTPEIDCPWNLEDFVQKNQESEFIKHIPKEIIDVQNEDMQHHIKHLYSKVHQVLSKEPKKSEGWVAAYSSLNQFLLSEKHARLCENLFNCRPINRHQNKFSTKLLLWLMDSEIRKKAADIVAQQQLEFEDSDKTVEAPSPVAQSKIRYLAGACIHKISEKIQKSVQRTLGKLSKSSRLGRKISYHKQKIMKQLRISEENTESNDPSMTEILYKQGASRGLFIVNDCVYKFFVQANNFLQAYLKPEFIHLHICHLQGHCRNQLLGNEELLEAWLNLFQSLETDDREEEIVMSLLLDLFAEVINYFIKLALVDAIKEFKEVIPRKKKQALRSKITALGERGGQKTSEPKRKGKKYSSVHSSVAHENEPSTSQPVNEINIKCAICEAECEWEPSDVSYESIACDKCNNWVHYACVGIKGDEAFLFKKNSKWHCPICKPSMKGKGKGRGKGKKS